MAKYVQVYENGSVKSILTFRGIDFVLTMIPDDTGMYSLEKCLDIRVTTHFPDIKEDLEDANIDLDCISSEDEILEALELLDEIE